MKWKMNEAEKAYWEKMSESEIAFWEWWLENKAGFSKTLTASQPEEAWYAAVKWERKKCWDAINQMIEPGDLGVSGWDKNAERNGLILASNAIMQRLNPAKPPDKP